MSKQWNASQRRRGLSDGATTRAPQIAKQFYETMLITDGFRLAFVESETSSELIELCNL
jgi:hypothetical protein